MSTNLRSYNSFGLAHLDQGILTVSLFAFAESGLMYKVVKNRRVPAKDTFVSALAFDLVPGEVPTFKVGFLDNSPGSKSAAQKVGLARFLRECSDELSMYLSGEAVPVH